MFVVCGRRPGCVPTTNLILCIRCSVSLHGTQSVNSQIGVGRHAALFCSEYHDKVSRTRRPLSLTPSIFCVAGANVQFDGPLGLGRRLRPFCCYRARLETPAAQIPVLLTCVLRDRDGRPTRSSR